MAPVRPRPVSGPILKAPLEDLYARFDRPDAAIDPVDLVRPYADLADREIAGFLAAGLAFGRVASILASIGAVLEVVGPRPAAFVRAFDPARDAAGLEGFVHRWVRGADLVVVLRILQAMLARSGSLEAFFGAEHDAAACDIGPALSSFSRRAIALASTGCRAPGLGVTSFFARPERGSACKRLNLFLRWMVRRDRVDPGGWVVVAPSQLVVPLDTHVVRVGQCLGLTRRRTPGWAMALEITGALRAVDPRDPVKYDFALCHLGMLNACGFSRPQRDALCPLRGLCRPGRRRRTACPAPSALR